MKIAPKAADAFLAKPAQYEATLLYGPDAGMIRDRAKRISAAILGAASADPFALVELTEAKILADPALLADELASVSMMAPKRVILIRDAGDKLTKIIEASAPHFNAAAYLVVCGDELSTKSSLRAWFEKQTNVAAVACYHDEVRDVQGVIRKAFEEANIVCDRDVLEYLGQQLGNDRYVTYQELEKIITYAGGEKLTLEDVRALVDYNRETNMDDIVNAIADKNLKELERTLTLLLREGTQPIVYLRALLRYFNRLYAMKSQVAAGQFSVDQVVEAARPPIFFRQKPIITRHIQNWGLEQITRALTLLIAAELSCKSSDIPAIAASSRGLMQVATLR